MRRTMLIALLAAIALAPFRPRADEGKTLAVLTFNVFDPFFGPEREARMEKLPAAVMALSPAPDVMVFEEFFKERDREAFVAGLKKLGYPAKTVHYHDRPGSYGPGILLVSRFDLEDFKYRPYHVDGDLYDPEAYSGKGVFHWRLKTDAGPLEIFGSHPIARFKELYDENGNHIDRDRRTKDRLIEMEVLARAVKDQTPAGARSVIVLGDLNTSPDMWSYQYLLARAGLSDSYAEANPGQNESTYSPENTYVAGTPDFSRIDHILYRNQAGSDGLWLKTVSSEVVFKQPAGIAGGKTVNLSDHFGVLSVFELVVDESAAVMNPPFRPAKITGSRVKSDITEAGLRLTPENHLAWQAWAVDCLYRADARYNRLTPLAVPAARVVIAGDVAAPTVIPLTSSERLALKMDLLAAK